MLRRSRTIRRIHPYKPCFTSLSQQRKLSLSVQGISSTKYRAARHRGDFIFPFGARVRRTESDTSHPTTNHRYGKQALRARLASPAVARATKGTPRSIDRREVGGDAMIARKDTSLGAYRTTDGANRTRHHTAPHGKGVRDGRCGRDAGLKHLAEDDPPPQSKFLCCSA